MKKSILLLWIISFLVGCKQSDSSLSIEQITPDTTIKVEEIEPAVADVEMAHEKSAFLDMEVVQFDLDLSFGGQSRLNGTVSLSTDSKYIRIDKTDGTSLIYDGDKVWMSPQDADDSGARFDIFTWSYFFSLPYKLTDDGTIINVLPNTEDYKVIQLTFEQGTGDAPDDWYEIYVDKETNRIDHAGYIVTYGGTPADKAAQNAHAIAYGEYKEVKDIPIATSWKFYNYSNKVDRSNIIGEATITNIQFKGLNEVAFSTPENAKEIKL
ncbi:hypothetical protein AAU57_12425 [Nonlabens sp. YIK11]|uniref:DUF6503 family protein n=1 Tax=Nonlabens sp. YIK11 TaxID=1453349 RepID=UPI0006DD2513|nr:DUF6503 family protein [Nonlabens sp. YIK11]KQC34046.1 hypothetical protein AAU57_12425 [Nonlabens sp. YIK11]